MGAVDELKERLLSLARDGYGEELGDEMLVILAKPHQLTTPDEEALAIHELRQALLDAFWNPPEAFVYPRNAYRDELVSISHRGNWAVDHHAILMIDAYMFGCKVEVLPEPHFDRTPEYFYYGRTFAHSIMRRIQEQLKKDLKHVEEKEKISSEQFRKAVRTFEQERGRLYARLGESPSVNTNLIHRRDALRHRLKMMKVSVPIENAVDPFAEIRSVLQSDVDDPAIKLMAIDQIVNGSKHPAAVPLNVLNPEDT